MKKHFAVEIFSIGFLALVVFGILNCSTVTYTDDAQTARTYNGAYEGPSLNRVAFPIGGIGAGMICLEGTGALSHVSVRNEPDIYNEPCTFAAVSGQRIRKGGQSSRRTRTRLESVRAAENRQWSRGKQFRFAAFHRCLVHSSLSFRCGGARRRRCSARRSGHGLEPLRSG